MSVGSAGPDSGVREPLVGGGDDGGSRARLAGVVADATERARAEAARGSGGTEVPSTCVKRVVKGVGVVCCMLVLGLFALFWYLMSVHGIPAASKSQKVEVF